SCAFMSDPPSSSFWLCPAALPAAILLRQPLHQRLEILDDCTRVHLSRAGQLLERILPGLAATKFEHVLERAAGFLVTVNRALVQRPLEARLLAQRPLELELHDEGQEIARI